jgi:ABC-type Mn2+/Zn2+ transport system ATPase subunit
MIRLRAVHISYFRGISNPMDIDFCNSSGKAQSVVLLGDNGSGKTSIADAIEFCLRGKVSRRGNAGIKNRREAKNLLFDNPPNVYVELDNNKSYGRGLMNKTFSGRRMPHDEFVEGFSLAPATLNRADIEMFWHVPPVERMRFFFDYLRDQVKHAGYAALEAERAEQKLAVIREKLLLAQISLAGITEQPVNQIPTDTSVAFLRWIRQMYPNYGKSINGGSAGNPGRRKRGASRDGIPMHAHRSISQLSALIEKKEQITKHLEANRLKSSQDGGISGILAEQLPVVLTEISEEVTQDFVGMANLSHIKAISIRSSPTNHALEINCSLSTGKEVDPTQVLSEGALDLLALLILLGVARACARRGQARFLVLDDVWQSVDAVHRDAILNYLFVSRFKDWQLLITVHDRLWARLIEDRARRNNFSLKTIELVRWSPTEGPQLRSVTLNAAARLTKLIDEADPEVIGSYSGRFLEQLADELSQEMRTSLSRAPGDRYDLGALWPGIFSALKKSGLPQKSKDAAKAVEDAIVLRNLYAAHYQQWAESFTSSEIRVFAERIVELWNATHCSTCWRPLTLSIAGNDRVISFPCAHSTTEDAND